MLFLFLTSIGALTVARQRIQYDYDVLARPNLLRMERMLDAENERLDRELTQLLIQHRRLAAGSTIDRSAPFIDADLLARFALLEEAEDGET